MKKILTERSPLGGYKILKLIIGFILITGIVYASATVASSRKSNKLPWQGNKTGFYDSAHNVGTGYIAQSRFSFASGTSAGGTSVVLDSVTGLYWQSNSIIPGPKTWNLAKTYCADLILGGYSDWRLPNLKESCSIIDLSKWSPAIDTTYFTNDPIIGYYWTSTRYAYNSISAWRMSFASGGTGAYNMTDNYYVRCVR